MGKSPHIKKLGLPCLGSVQLESCSFFHQHWVPPNRQVRHRCARRKSHCHRHLDHEGYHLLRTRGPTAGHPLDSDWLQTAWHFPWLWHACSDPHPQCCQYQSQCEALWHPVSSLHYPCLLNVYERILSTCKAGAYLKNVSQSLSYRHTFLWTLLKSQHISITNNVKV